MPRLSLLSFASRLVALGSLAFALSSCERGCASTWVKTRKQKVMEVPASFGRGIDCPDGLARCVGGVVEASRLARIAMPCKTTETPESCACPWVAVADCPRGCAAEGVSLLVPPDRAVGRLCAQDPSNPVSRPAPAAVAPPGSCTGEERDGYRCVGSLVVSCVASETRATVDAGNLASHVVAACLRGCAHGGDEVGADEANADGASRILCAP